MSSFYFHIPCAGTARLSSLWATLCNVAHQLSDYPEKVTVAVSFNAFDVKEELARINDGHGVETVSAFVDFECYEFDPSVSVAQMYALAADRAAALGYAYLIKLDDDVLVTGLPSFLSELTRVAPDYACFSFWDVVNNREYDDWYPSVHYSRLADLIASHGVRTLWCQRWLEAPPHASYSFSPDSKINASMFSVKLSRHLLASDGMAAMRAWRKGVRGMDLHMSSQFTERFFFFGTQATHLGVFRPQLDGTYWTSFKSAAHEIPQSRFIHDSKQNTG